MIEQKTLIGRAEMIEFPEIALENIPARIDTGAKTSSLWASHIEEKDGKLHVLFLDAPDDAEKVVFDSFDVRPVASSNGHVQRRYVVTTLVVLAGRKVRAEFTLADRSLQVYPVLIGRNVLRDKFIVDVAQGGALRYKDRVRSPAIQSHINNKEEQ